MAIVRALVSFRHDSGLPRDASTNTFHFNSDATSAQGALIVGNLSNFWNSPNITDPIAIRMAASLTGTADVKLYDVTQPLAPGATRVPFYTSTFTFTNGASSLPGEVAVCLSYQAAPISGLNQARRRGRIFLGPLANSSSVHNASTTIRPATSIRTDLGTAASRLETESAADNAPWVVFSPTNYTTALVTDGWVDDAFDTIRSRGERATTRTTWG